MQLAANSKIAAQPSIPAGPTTRGGHVIPDTGSLHLETALTGRCKHSRCEGELHNCRNVPDPASFEVGWSCPGDCPGVLAWTANQPTRFCSLFFLIFSSDVNHSLQYVLPRHSIEKQTDEIIIPFVFSLVIGLRPVAVQGLPKLRHALHARTIRVQSLCNQSQHSRCHLQQVAAERVGVRCYRAPFSKLLLSL